MNLNLDRRRILILISLLIIIPLGLFSKAYTGVAQEWVRGYSGAILYEIFWCLLFGWFFPSKQAIAKIPLWVFVVTCAIEVTQLWFKFVPVAIRSTLIWKLLLGSSFAWWDFPHYALGSLLGWLWLKALNNTKN